MATSFNGQETPEKPFGPRIDHRDTAGGGPREMRIQLSGHIDTLTRITPEHRIKTMLFVQKDYGGEINVF